jgi:hypothetical protein
MTGNSLKKEQQDLFRPLLEGFIDKSHKLVLIVKNRTGLF